MKQATLGALIGITLLFFGHGSADAMTEFCPAVLHYERVGPEIAAKKPGNLYGFDLTALGPRTITGATLAFDTSGGWYTVDVPGVTLTENLRHYTSPYNSITERDYVSPVFYGKFPSAVTVAHAWVYEAATQGDSLFGWDSEGMVQCEPFDPDVRTIALKGGRTPTHTTASTSIYVLDAHDRDPLSSPPRPGALIVDATPAKPLERTSCAEPFREAMVTSPARPDYPLIMRNQDTGEVQTSVEIAIDASGILRDSWIWATSGYGALDNASLTAARQSKYEPALAYCKPVPSESFFRVTFDPNG